MRHRERDFGGRRVKPNAAVRRAWRRLTEVDQPFRAVCEADRHVLDRLRVLEVDRRFLRGLRRTRISKEERFSADGKVLRRMCFALRPVGVALVRPDNLVSVRGDCAVTFDHPPLARLLVGVGREIPASKVNCEIRRIADLDPVDALAAVRRHERRAIGRHNLGNRNHAFRVDGSRRNGSRRIFRPETRVGICEHIAERRLVSDANKRPTRNRIAPFRIRRDLDTGIRNRRDRGIGRLGNGNRHVLDIAEPLA